MFSFFKKTPTPRQEPRLDILAAIARLEDQNARDQEELAAFVDAVENDPAKLRADAIVAQAMKEGKI